MLYFVFSLLFPFLFYFLVYINYPLPPFALNFHFLSYTLFSSAAPLFISCCTPCIFFSFSFFLLCKNRQVSIQFLDCFAFHLCPFFLSFFFLFFFSFINVFPLCSFNFKFVLPLPHHHPYFTKARLPFRSFLTNT